MQFVALERDAKAQAALPNHAATLSCRAVEQFKALRKHDMFLQLQARAARSVIDEDTLDRGRFRTDENLRRA